MISLSRAFHICYVETGYPHPHGGGGGAGTYVQIIGKDLVRRGHRISVVASWCPTCPEESLDDGVHVYRPKQTGYVHWYCGKLPALRIFSLSLRYLEFGWQTNSFIRKLNKFHPIDLIEYSEGGDFWHRFDSTLPYLCHLHGSRYTCLKASGRYVNKSDWIHRRLELFFVEKAQHVVSPSKALLGIVENESNRRFDSSNVIPYPLDPKLEMSQNQRKEMNIDKNVFFVGREDPIKGREVLLKAVPLVHAKVLNAKFHLFGSPPDGNETVLQGNVTYHNFVPKEILVKRYQEADLCVVPSFWDNSPNTVYEAMAAGKAVVASRVGGIPELVEDGVTGILVEPGRDRELANAIIDLLINNEKRILMGERGRERILRLARMRDNVQKRLDLYEQVINISRTNQLPKKIAR